jgi:hypothetical protein
MGTIFKSKQISNLNNFKTKTNFKLDQITNLNKFEIGTNFKSELILNQNKFQNLNRLRNLKKIQTLFFKIKTFFIKKSKS